MSKKDENKNEDELIGGIPVSNISPAIGINGPLSVYSDISKVTGSYIDSANSFTSLATRINEMCGRSALSDKYSFHSPLSGINIWGDYTKNMYGQTNAVLNNSINQDVLNSGLSTVKISDGLLSPSRWTFEPTNAVVVSTKEYNPYLKELGSLEIKTSALAIESGISPITSVASQISTITGLFGPKDTSIKDFIAPPSMMTDLRSLAIRTHESFIEEGKISKWGLGVLDSASYLADRQIDWTSHLCNSVYGEAPITSLSDIGLAAPNVNVISWLPAQLDIEKQKREKITPEEALEESQLYIISERGKRLIDKIIDVNKICERTGRKPIFKYTSEAMRAAASMSGTFCSSRKDFGEIIDGLYVIFYENLSHFKEYVPDEVIRSDDIFQCVFRVKTIRTDYRHDYEHGSDSQIRKAERKIGDSYSYYSGKPVLIKPDDFQTTQLMLYDEFENLADYMLDVVSKSIS